MKKQISLCIRPYAITLLSLMFMLNAVVAQTKKESSPQVRQKTFDVVWKTINEKFYDPNFGGVDWSKVRERYAPQVANVKSDDELYELIGKMLKELRVSHLEIITPDDLNKLAGPPVTTGLGLRDIDNQIVITRVLEGSPAEKAGLRLGFVIKKIDDTDVIKSGDVNKIFAGPEQKYRVSFLNERDELGEIVLEKQTLTSDQIEKEQLTKKVAWYSLIESKRLTDNIGYIHFTGFINSLKKKLLAAIESMRDSPGIIIDLRGNGGGEDELAIAMAGMLFNKETQLMITRTRKGNDFYYKAKPQKNPYLGPVVILVDERSGSASEQISAGLQETGRAVIVGRKTKGEDLDADGKELPTGAVLLYPYGQPHTPKGVIIEGRGVIPDIEVSLTRAELLKGKDSQLEAAIEYIRNKK